MSKKDQIINCEHCGNKTPNEILLTTNGPDEIVEMFPENYTGIKTYYFLTKCKSCEEISLFSDWEESDQLGDLNNAVLVYPSIKKIDAVVPAEIVKGFNEAKKVKHKSSLAFAVMIRRAMEGVCLDQSAKGKNLKEKIDDLAKKEIIPNSLGRMANAIRYIGNAGAHAKGEDVTDDEVKVLDEFMRAIIEYVYVAPAKLNKLAEKLKKK